MAVPDFSSNEIKVFVHDIYGLSVKQVKKYDGYDDVTFFVGVEEAGAPKNDPLKGYVFKIMNVKKSPNVLTLKAEIHLMQFVRSRIEDVLVPRIVNPLTGDNLAFIEIPEDGTRFPVRLSEFITGNMLAFLSDEPSAKTLVRLGHFIGEFSVALKSFSDPDMVDGQKHLWSLDSVVSILPDYLSAVEDPVQLTVFREVIQDFAIALSEFGEDLEIGVIHGDMNEGNIVMEKLTDSADWDLKGLIDFSDAHRTYIIFELALAICYMMLECEKKKTLPVLEAGGFMLKGYLPKRQLQNSEREILKIAIEARIVQSLVIGQHTFKNEQPGNMYILNTQKHGWTVLKLLRSLKKEALYGTWDEILVSKSNFKNY